MAVPLILNQSTAFVNALSAPFFSAVSGIVDSSLLPGKYSANGLLRTLMPGPDAIHNSYMRGYTSKSVYYELMARHNINVDPEYGTNVDKNLAAMWSAVLNAQIPRLSLEQIIYGYYAGFISKSTYDKVIKRYKYDNDQLDSLYELVYAKFDPGIIMQSYFRGKWEEDKTVSRLRKFYGCDENDARTILDNANFIPPPGDLVRYAVRDVFNEQVRKDDRLEEEFEDNKDLRDWFNAQGIGVVTIKSTGGQEKTLDVPMAEWVSHWQLPSPTQVYEGLHRLRPNRLERYRDVVPDVTSVTIETVNKLLKQADYSPKWRPMLAAISYSVPRLIDIKNMYFEDVFKEDELKEKLLDRGNSPADATDIVEYYKIVKQKKKDKEEDQKHAKAYNKLKQAIYTAYKQGSISRAVAFNGLLQTDLEVEDANIILNAIDIEVNARRVQKFIDMVKREFFLGLYDGIEAYNQLVQGGLNDMRAAQLVAQWQRELSMPRKIASTQKLIEWYSNGFIGVESLMQRLEKMGWANPDILLYISEAQLSLEKNRARILAAQARDERQREAAARRLVTQARSDRLASIQDFYRHSSPSDMKQWYRDGLLSSEDIYDRLTIYMGWTTDDATRFVKSLTGEAETNGQ